MKNSKLMFSLSIVILIGAGACSSAEKNEVQKVVQKIQSPLPGVEIPTDKFSLDPTIENSIQTKEGTTIFIPKNSLVDDKGRKITSIVDLSFQSINTPGEIIASGIPMVYDSAGVKNDFISAGMFSIHAKSKGKEVFIEKGKQIDVDFASYKEGDDFSFYKIDEKSGKWSYKGISKSKKNVNKIEKLKNFANDNLLQFDIDYSMHQELKPFHGLKWICIDEKNVDNPSKNNWMHKEFWYDIDLKIADSKKGIYNITLSNEYKTASFKISPYQMDDNSVADLNNKIGILNETIRLKKVEEEKIQFQADINRSYPISSFGTYNWDKIIKEMEKGALAVTDATFKVDSKLIENDVNVYHFSGKNNLLSRITKNWDKLLYNPKEINKLLIVLPDNYVAVTDINEFNHINNKGQYIFNLKKRAKKIKSIQELDEILAQN